MQVLATAASGRGRLRLSPRLILMPAFCTEVWDTPPLAMLVLAMVLTVMLLLPLLPPLPPSLPPPTVWAMPVLAMLVLATAASGRGRLRLSPRPMLMPAFCTEVLVTLPLAMLVLAMVLTDMALLLPLLPQLLPLLPPLLPPPPMLLPPPSATAPLDTAATVCGNQLKADHDNTTSQS